MSLDIHLEIPAPVITCPHCGGALPGSSSDAIEVHSQNITHNLGPMAADAGIYEALWHAEDIRDFNAGKLAAILEPAISEMKAYPDKYRRKDASNGWGTYDQFVPWLERLLEACKENPECSVRSSR